MAICIAKTRNDYGYATAVAVQVAWSLLDQINDWIRFADAKAGAVLAASGALGALLVSDIPRLEDFETHTTRAVLLTLAVVCVGISSLLCLQVLAPRVRVGEARSLIYFEHIARRYAENRAEFVDMYLRLVKDDADLARQVAEQVWANSRVAHRKFRHVSFAVRALGVAMVSAGAAVAVERLWGW